MSSFEKSLISSYIRIVKFSFVQYYILLLGVLISLIAVLNIKTHNRSNYYLVIFLIAINFYI